MGHSKVEKTNAARLLDRAKIAYELVPYAVDEEHLAATHVAEQLGEDIACVFKTLVLKGDRTGYFVCVVPGDHEVDLKAAARVSGNKKVDLIPVKELLPVTGRPSRPTSTPRPSTTPSSTSAPACGGSSSRSPRRSSSPTSVRPWPN